MEQTVLVVGAGGQLGQELQRTAASGIQCAPMTRAQLDIADAAAVAKSLASVAPGLVINAAAYTAVDNAESEPEAAARGNAEGPTVLARACVERGIRLIHISTDFVFDGDSSTPYTPESATAPLGEYGRSKLAGENGVQNVDPNVLIVRTGWVYSSFGNNFVKTMLRLMSERDELAVVSDQVGTPTWAHGFAEAVWAAAGQSQLSGVYHWSDAGVCSWYDFAVAIRDIATEKGLLSSSVSISPICTEEYPTPAERPAYSVLDKSSSYKILGSSTPHWRDSLAQCLESWVFTDQA